MPERKPRQAEVIRADVAQAKQWVPPDVRMHGERAAKAESGLLTAAQVDEIRKAAQAEGYEQGHKEGLAFGHREGLETGRADLQDRVARMDSLLKTLDRPFERLDQQVEDEIVALVINMVRQLLRREVKLDHRQIVGVVREALSVLPVSARNIRVVLHPDDAELVRQAYTLTEHDQQWQIVEDPVIQRGGCRVHTDTSQVDATLDSRLNSLIAPLVSAERVADSGERHDGDA